MERLGNTIARACAQIHPDGPQPLRLVLRGTIRPFPVDNFEAGAPFHINQHRKGGQGRIQPEVHPHTTSTKVNNGPDRPRIERIKLPGASVRLVGTFDSITRDATVVVEKTSVRYYGRFNRLTKKKDWDTVPGRSVTPTVAKPTTPFQVLDLGERTITFGGGTSDKALSRGRKRQRRRA